ncbi:MAG: HAMP domain-containing sensor histidine kinase [Candidatus Pseudobacter hemicellulosilyticus]|uniref:histidine kinase n=1 Tax=Candidatus Pseudobacter hemicellulosilyticus TaxID=3121375 RepID=A0AAJ5X0T2_9BACT|nr:MAG: HAMP domain-containing sensor histidine kinase [Pseudobacter sp.]
MTIRRKITGLMTILTAVITVMLSVSIYYFTSQYIEDDFFTRIKTRAGVAGQARFEATDHNMAFYNEIREKHLQRLPEEKEYILENGGATALLDSLIPGEARPFLRNLQLKKDARLRKGDNYYFGTTYEHAGRSYIIILTAQHQQGAHLLSNLGTNLLTGFILSVGIVFLLSHILSREVMSPIRHVIDNARKISASNLHLRLQERKGKAKGEMAALTQTFNDMLDRLETSFETQNNFLSKAAHELRTPLTAISGEAELALSKPRSADEYIKALIVIARQAEQLEHHTSSLLELAQAGYNSKEPFMSELRLDELLFSVKRLVDFTDPENKVQMDFNNLPELDYQITIAGNANLLKLALANIVQNGVKYSNNQPVYVSLSSDEAHCIISVRDTGIGIPEKELKYIFDPFFRASNTNPFKGYGIGLPLAQKIIRLHRGQLRYYSREHEGTTVQLFFPFVWKPD